MTVSSVLLWLHPLMQLLAAVFGVVAMYQGIKKIRMLLGTKIIFPWKQHVKLGSWTLGLWILGGLGFYVTHDIFGETHVTGAHAYLAWPVIVLSIFGLITGCIMDRRKKKRKILPLVHGLLNIILIVLVAIVFITGIPLFRSFVAG